MARSYINEHLGLFSRFEAGGAISDFSAQTHAKGSLKKEQGFTII